MTVNLSSSSKQIDTILVLDFGSQYTQLIARRVRESNVYSEILPWDIDEEKIKLINPKGIILSGGPDSVTNSYTPRVPQTVFDLNIPILGICYGMQTLAEQLGGQVISSDQKEFGYSELQVTLDCVLFSDLGKTLNVWMSHGDQVQDLPDNFDLVAATATAPIAAMQHTSKPIYALQFHPEVTHTEDGKTVLDNFIFKVCGSKKDWKMDDLIGQRIKEIKDQVQNNKVLLGLSGGVDSSVTAALLNKAIGNKLVCVFVDNGLLRKGEAEEVMNTFKENMNLNVIKSDSEEVFLRHLKGVEDPEQKRKIIGRTFIDVFDAEATKLKDVHFLAQGTIYPDVIESSGSESKEARVIKSHHNVGGLPEEMKMDLVEPLRDLFKDEVRRMGVELALVESKPQCFDSQPLWRSLLSSVPTQCAHIDRPGHNNQRRYMEWLSGQRSIQGLLRSLYPQWSTSAPRRTVSHSRVQTGCLALTSQGLDRRRLEFLQQLIQRFRRTDQTDREISNMHLHRRLQCH